MKELITSLGKDGLKSAYSLLSDFALWLTIAIAVVLAVIYVVLAAKKADLTKFKSVALGFVIG